MFSTVLSMWTKPVAFNPTVQRFGVRFKKKIVLKEIDHFYSAMTHD